MREQLVDRERERSNGIHLFFVTVGDETYESCLNSSAGVLSTQAPPPPPLAAAAAACTSVDSEGLEQERLEQERQQRESPAAKVRRIASPAERMMLHARCLR